MWLDDQREGAADIGVLEREFWVMTPRQLGELADIHTRRERREWERSAWMVHHIMAAWVGDKAPSIDQLLGRVTKL